MGASQQFRTSATWDQATNFLDHSFPLAAGSHASATAYLVYFDHLVVIQADGSATGLSSPAQFVEAGGNFESPQSIVLQSNGLQVEIEPDQACAKTQGCKPNHRMQLVTHV